MSIVTEKTTKQGTKEVGTYYPSGGVPRTPLEQRHGPHPKKVSFIDQMSPTQSNIYFIIPKGFSYLENTTVSSTERREEARIPARCDREIL